MASTECTFSFVKKKSRAWLNRIQVFLKQMFPPFPTQLLAFGTSALTYLILARVFVRTPVVPKELVLGGFSALLFQLQLRVFDELKDYKSDKVNFPDRPLVTGVVSKRDLHILVLAINVALFALQLPFLARPVMGAYGLALFCSFLSFRWFFAEKRIRSSLPLALVTHQPLGLVLQLYTLSFFLDKELVSFDAVLFLVALALGSTAWELARKMRGTQQEEDYVTYTKLWGVRSATAVFMCVLSVSMVLAIVTIARGSDSLWVRAAWLLPMAAYGAAAKRAADFVRKPRTAPRIRQAAEHYAYALLAAMFLSSLLGA